MNEIENHLHNSLIIEATEASTWVWDLVTNEVSVNDRWFKMTGYEKSDFKEISVFTWYSLVYEEDLPKAKKAIDELIEGKKETYKIDLRIKKKDGSLVWVLDMGKIVKRDQNDKPLLMSGAHIDINETKIDEIKKAESDAKMYQDKKVLYETNVGFKEFKLEV